MSTFWFSRNSRNGIVSSLAQRTGFSAVEGLVVLGLISMMAGLSVPLYRTYQIRSDLNLATEHIVQSLARAQSLAQSGQNDMPWGVYVQEGTLFAGETYVFRDQSQDEVFVIPSTIDASGLEEVVYTRLEGLPVETGTIILTALNGEYREIIIDDFGRISVGDLQSPPVFPGGTAGDDDGGVGGETAGSEGGDDGGTDATGGSGGTDDDDGGDTGTAGTAGDDGGSEGGTDGGTDGGSAGDTAGDDGGSDAGGGDDEEEEGIGECGSTFSVQGEDVKTVGTVDLTLKVLGSEITYGAGGPPVQVRLAASIDDGDTWSDLFGGNPVSTNDTVTFENLPEGTPVSLRFNGRYSWLFNKTYRSDDSDGHVLILRDGDKPPNYKPFANQSSLASFLRSILDDKGRINIGSRDLVFLTELGTLDKNADFQDAVVLATFTQKALTCSPSTEPRVKISFQRLQNSGNGDVENKVFVGTQGTAFAEEQWIPLTSNGQVIVDGGLKEAVKGLAIERGPGWIRVLNRGAHISSQSKELLDARVLFNKAYITSVVNDEGANASENPTDGVVNDGPDGDEFIGGPNEKSMVFASRVSSDKDAVILYWTTGNPPSGQDQQEPSDPSDETDTATDESEETDDDDDANDQEAAIDPCAVPFTVHEDGRITLGGNADVSIRVAGSESTYGYRGPRVQVRSQVRIGNGSFEPLFGYRSLKGGELVTFSDRSEGSDIALEFNGRYTWLFSSTARSGESDPRVRVLTRGQYAPTVPLINARTSLKSFLRNILTAEGTINVTNRQVAVLVELGELNNTADYQDAVLILSIDKPASEGRCGSSVSDDASDNETGGEGGSDQNDEGQEGGETSGNDDASSGDSDPNGDSDGDSVANASDLCPGTFMPESVPTEQMLFDRYALTAKSPIFRVGPRKRISQYSLSDTHGCSCGQILDAIEGRSSHRLNEYPVLFRTLQGLFSFYVRSSRQFGCGEALMEIVSQRR